MSPPRPQNKLPVRYSQNERPEDLEAAEWAGQDRRQPPPAPQPQHGGIKFDATINLGHILTFVGFLVAGFTAWTTLDKRVTVIEERANLQAVVDRNQDAQLTNNMIAIRESLSEIKQQITRIQDRRSTP
jgi:hypothetical protein